MRRLATRLQHDVTRLQRDVSGLQHRVSGLRATEKRLHPTVGRVRRVAARLQSDVSRLQPDVSATPTPATDLRRDVETLRVAHEKPMPTEILVRHPQGRVTRIQARAHPRSGPFFIHTSEFSILF